jgi:hypothetical protein
MRNLSYSVLLAGLVGLVGAGSAAGQDAKWVTIKGQIVFAGNPPALPPLMVNKDQGHCLAKGPVPNEEWVINSTNKGIKNVVVWITGASGARPAIHPNLAQIKDKNVSLDQPVCAFVPHTLAMREGQILTVMNTAPVAHNVNWQGGRAKNPGGNVIVPPGGKHVIPNLKADRQQISVTCNIHGWMKGWIRVFDHPYYAVTDENGNFEIKLAPADATTIFYWHDTGWKDGAAGANGFPLKLTPGKDNDLGKIDWKPAG